MSKILPKRTTQKVTCGLSYVKISLMQKAGRLHASTYIISGCIAPDRLVPYKCRTAKALVHVHLPVSVYVLCDNNDSQKEFVRGTGGAW